MLYADDTFKRAASLSKNMAITLRGHHLVLLYGMMMAKERGEKSYSFKKERLIRTALQDRHSREHGENMASVLERALDPGEYIKLTDTIDDICKTCNENEERKCVEFIPYDVSAACEDRSVLHFYDLQRRRYTSRFIQKRLRERGIF